MAVWYYAQNGQQFGPVELDALRQLTGQGQLRPVDLVWSEGMSDWRPAAEVAELFAAPSLPLPMPIPATSPPVNPLGYASPRPTQYAGESHRNLALSSLILGCVAFVLGHVFTGIAALICAKIALNGMKRSGNYDGKGMAVAGLVLGIFWAVLGGIVLLVILLVVVGALTFG